MTKRLKALTIILAVTVAIWALPLIAGAEIYERGIAYLLGKNVLSTTGYFDRMRVGTGSTSGHSATGTDDSFMEGDLEVDGVIYADGGIVGASSVSYTDDVLLKFGTSNDFTCEWDTESTPDLFLCLPAADDTIWQIGNGSYGVDMKIPGSTTANYTYYDASGDLWTYANVGLTLAGTGALTVAGTTTLNGDIVLGNAVTDDITVGGSFNALSFANAVDTFDAASTCAGSGHWSQTTGTGWSIGLGSNNGRDGAREVCQVTNDTTAGDEMTINYGSVLDLTGKNYLGFWVYAASAVGATEFMVDLRTAANTVMTNCNDLAVPAITATDWTYVSIDISTCTSKDRFQKLVIGLGAGAAAETMDFMDFVFYETGSAYPALGTIVKYPVATGTVTRGQFACFTALNAAPKYGVATCSAASTLFAGVALTTSASRVALQTDDIVVVNTEAAILATEEVKIGSSGGVVQATTTPVDNTAIGIPLEAGADAGEYITIKLK